MKQKHLWECNTLKKQKQWCLAQFRAGKTLSYPFLWANGVDPDKIVESLRKDGVQLQTCYVQYIDANDTVHPKMLAWKM